MAIGVIINQPKKIEAEKVLIKDEDNIFQAEEKTVENIIKEVFTNVSDGKDKVATAITDMGIESSGDATFDELAASIKKVVGVAEMQKTKLNIVAPHTYEVQLNKPVSVMDICTSVLSHMANVENIVIYNCSFDNSDAENFVTNPAVTYDGTMRLDTRRDIYSFTITEIENLTTYESDPITKTEWRTIEGLELADNGVAVMGLNYPVFVEAVGDIDFTGVNEVESINWASVTNESGVALLLVSIDSGITWKSFYNNEWIDVDVSKLEDIKAFGMSSDIVNALTVDDLSKLVAEWEKIRFGYYLELEDMTGQAMNDNISITVAMQGDVGIADSSSYEYSLSPERDKLVYSFTQDGTYTINALVRKDY